MSYKGAWSRAGYESTCRNSLAPYGIERGRCIQRVTFTLEQEEEGKTSVADTWPATVCPRRGGDCSCRRSRSPLHPAVLCDDPCSAATVLSCRTTKHHRGNGALPSCTLGWTRTLPRAGRRGDAPSHVRAAWMSAKRHVASYAVGSAGDLVGHSCMASTMSHPTPPASAAPWRPPS